MLHIHPLTLEDILQQDPREKLEIFGKLGYYFISFRAIESQATKEKIRREVGLKDYHDESSIGEANVYLTVFKGGICCVSSIAPIRILTCLYSFFRSSTLRMYQNTPIVYAIGWCSLSKW